MVEMDHQKWRKFSKNLHVEERCKVIWHRAYLNPLRPRHSYILHSSSHDFHMASNQHTSNYANKNWHYQTFGTEDTSLQLPQSSTDVWKKPRGGCVHII